MKQIIKKLFRDKVFISYVLSGGAVSVMELIIFAWLIYTFRWPYLQASALIFFFGLIASFVARKIWVFPKQSFHSNKKQLLLYSAVFGASTLVNLLIMFVLIDRLHISELIAQVIAMTLVGFFTFTANKTITFKPLPTRELSLTKYIESKQKG